MKSKYKKIINTLCVIALINLAGTASVYFYLRGRAFTGKITNGIYYVGYGDEYNKVSPSIYWFSMYYEIGTSVLLVFAGISKAFLNSKEKKEAEIKTVEIYCFTGKADGDIEKTGIISAVSDDEASKIIKKNG